MRYLASAAFVLSALVAAAPIARAQETDEEIKRRIMDRVRQRLNEEKKAILDRMAKVIDEELAAGPKKATKPAAGDPKAPDKRIRDLERKLQQLDDQRDDLMRDIRGIRRETEDAKIIQESKAVPKELEDAAEAQDESGAEEAFKALKEDFDGYNKIHADKDYDKSIVGFKKLYYGLKASKFARPTSGLWIPAAYNVACGYALQGKATEAIDWLEMAIKDGYNDWDHIRQDGDFDSIRKERRYLRLLADR